jgi:putative hydrolase of the HAD superfamily
VAGRLRAALFDAAGTLIGPAEPVGESYARAAAAHGAAIPAWRLDDAFRRVLRRAPPMAFPGEPPARVAALERGWWRERVRETLRAADQTARVADFDGFFDSLFAHFARPQAWRARPGAGEALVALRGRGLRLAVVSNFDHRLEPILAGLGLAGFFEAVVRPAHAGAAKPAAAIFTFALARLGVAPGEAVYVGDDAEQDVAAARAAGLAAIDVAELATLAELPAWIAALEPDA